jgi:spore coat protein A, manganese oxidase
VEPRQYRLRYLNGCDSRFLILQFVQIHLNATNIPSSASPLPFTVIGTDQGLTNKPRRMTTLVLEPGARYDIIFDFAVYDMSRVVLRNIGEDQPFGGTYDDESIPTREGSGYTRTDRIMAFDVTEPFNDGSSSQAATFDSNSLDVLVPESPVDGTSYVRKLGLFEGRDPYNRLMPMLGTIGPATDPDGNILLYPDTEHFNMSGLAGTLIEGSLPWSDPVTERLVQGRDEEWEIWNLSVDAHPIHLHLVSFMVVGRNDIVWDSNTNEEGRDLYPEDAAGDGTYMISRPVVLHDGTMGKGYVVKNPVWGAEATVPDGYFEDGPKDMVVAFPGQVTRIKLRFDEAGEYVWHCHILSHEDNSMMRPILVRAKNG